MVILGSSLSHFFTECKYFESKTIILPASGFIVLLNCLKKVPGPKFVKYKIPLISIKRFTKVGLK